MEFNSQICTTKEQSERLLALGLKKGTADMVLLKELTYDEKRHCLCDADTYMIRPIDYLNGEEHRGNIPAWSLHRLIEMMPSTLQDLYELDFSKRGVYYADFSNGSFNFIQSFAKPTTTLYDNIINCIEWLIKENYFNKEHLE